MEAGEGRARVPENAMAIRLVRPVGDELREYAAMECESGAVGIDLLLRRALAQRGDYGLADFLDDRGDIVGDLDLDRRSFQLIKRRLRCRVVHPEKVDPR